MNSIVIVGAGLAGGRAAATLREEGFDGSVTLIGAEPHLPYERPPLSKEYLQGEVPFEQSLVHPLEFYADHGIETRFGAQVVRVDPEARVVELAGGDRVSFERLLVATGARNRRIAVPGFDLEGVYQLRTLEDADRIRAAAAAGRRAVVVGMGFIGAEVAASLRMLGVEVTAINPSPRPLFRVLGDEVGRVLEELHRDHGVELLLGDSATAIEGTGRVEAVTTTKGRRIGCDFVVVGVGVEPVTAPVAGTAVRIGNGIVVDQHCRTNVEGIYAAGDVANHYHPVWERHMRVEHWQNARQQGRAAARSMLGNPEPYAEIHWFWSDQYELNLQYLGFHTEWDRLVVRGSLERRDFVAFYLNKGRVDAAVAVNRGGDLRRATGILRARAPVDPAQLADDHVDLRSLVGRSASAGAAGGAGARSPRGEVVL